MALSQMQLVRQSIDAILDSMTASGGAFDPADLGVGVGSAIAATGIGVLLSDITPVTGAAGAVTPIAWGDPYLLNDGSAVVDSAAVEFRPVGAETGTVVVVYLTTLAGSGDLLGYMLEVPPVGISASHPYSVVVRLVVDPRGRWSVSFSWNG